VLFSLESWGKEDVRELWRIWSLRNATEPEYFLEFLFQTDVEQPRQLHKKKRKKRTKRSYFFWCYSKCQERQPDVIEMQKWFSSLTPSDWMIFSSFSPSCSIFTDFRLSQSLSAIFVLLVGTSIFNNAEHLLVYCVLLCFELSCSMFLCNRHSSKLLESYKLH
jgi:hypothetical protein